MTVAAPSDVQPSEPTADASNGVPVRTASAVWILIAGVVGLAAALTLTIEKIEILINPDYVIRYTKGKGGSVTMKNNKELEMSAEKRQQFLGMFEK